MKQRWLLLLTVLTISAACQKKSDDVNSANLVQAESPKTKKTIGDQQTKFNIIANQQLRNEMELNTIQSLESPETRAYLKALSINQVLPPLTKKIQSNSTASPSSLALGYPADLLHQQSVFGGVITGISNTEDENLGGLKLSDLEPIHVVSAVDEKTNQLIFIGCMSKCSESSEQSVILQIPILGTDPKAGILYLDMSTLGTQLNVMEIINPVAGMTHKASNLVLFDFSLNTLVFDVASDMTLDPSPDSPTEAETQVKITARWYLKLSSGFNPAFQPREQTEGVGYFTTSRSEKKWITRLSSTQYQNSAPVKYYVKNVPARYRKSFSDSFQSWNEKFKSALGHDMFEVEFLETTDPRFDLITIGDIRYNVLEWDLANLAPYGGLGPSIANQFTGEIFSANVLIQGPQIEQIYKKWFNLSQEVAELKKNGQEQLAEEKIVTFNRELNQIKSEKNRARHSIRLGQSLEFHIASEDPRHQDPLVPQLNFDETPEGYTYDSYMAGYFFEMVAHELGHNIGLRHNFRGNLGTDDSMKLGSVSRSIMEYLSRQFRHLDLIGEYDFMALEYGYTGRMPLHKNWFCTDEDQVTALSPQKSAECSSSDATSDPFKYFESRLDKAISLLVAKNSADIPLWKTTDMETQLDDSLNGLISYAVSAPYTAKQWTNFAQKTQNRPTEGNLISTFVLQRLNAKICSSAYSGIVEAKNTDAAKAQTLKNINDLQKIVQTLIKSYLPQSKILAEQKIPCLL